MKFGQNDVNEMYRYAPVLRTAKFLSSQVKKVLRGSILGHGDCSRRRILMGIHSLKILISRVAKIKLILTSGSHSYTFNTVIRWTSLTRQQSKWVDSLYLYDNTHIYACT